jgi:hypothetical protein
MRVRCGLLATAVFLVACDQTTQAGQAANQAVDKTQKAVDQAGKQVVDEASKHVDSATKQVDAVAKSASDAATKAAADALDTAKVAVDETRAATNRAWAGLTDTGELSRRASEWLTDTAESTDIRGVITKGVQVAPVALEIAKTINGAVDTETAIEPIYQGLDGRDPAEVDRAIAAMPRVEIVEGLKVGFHQLSRLDAGTSVDERAYLLTWRLDDHIIGMVYRTKRTIDLDKLVKEAPRLIALTQTALAAGTP